ncbi:unnamed protein product [Prunus armeniaca]
MANFINEKKPMLSNDDHDYDSWDEDNWLEIDCLQLSKLTYPVDVAFCLQETEADHVYDFLGGLNPHFNHVRSRILALTLVPSVLEAYVFGVEEDTCQSSMLGGNSAMAVILHRGPTGTSPTLAPCAPKPSDVKGTRKCTHCGRYHLVEKCFKLHGYLEWWDASKARNSIPKAACGMTSSNPPSHALLSDSHPDLGMPLLI